MKNGERLFDLGGGRYAHASGALWMPDARTLLLADVHLGFGWALRRRGHLGPVTDGGVGRKLADLVAELSPETVVFLGDLVHAPRPAPQERDMVERILRALPPRLVVVIGNHDRGFVRDYPELAVEVCAEWSHGGVVAVHGDKQLPVAEHVIAGHLHPAIGVVDHAGATRKVPAFVAGRNVTLLPAFSPFAAGFDVRTGLPLDMGDPIVVAASGRRAVALGTLSRLRSM
jgi:metallophosphoesterase superfamily enzyme